MYPDDTAAWRRACARLLVLFAVLTAVALMPAPAAAHANLVQSDPPAQSSVTRAPDQVQLLFSEPIEPRFIEVSVLNRDRVRVDKGDARLLDGTNDTVVASLGDLPPGVFTISWAVTSAVDGHTTRGLVPFNVGDPGAVPEPLSATEIGAATSGESSVQRGPAGVIARWLVLLSTLVLGGILVAAPLFLRPAAGWLDELRSGQDGVAVTREAPEQVITDALRRMIRLCWIALVAFLVGSLLLLLVDAAAAAGTSLLGALGEPIRELLGTRRGLLWLLRGALALALAVGLAVLFNRRMLPDSLRHPARWWALSLLPAGMLLATSLGSHSASLRSWSALATVVDWVHLCAVSVWVGGLVFLGLAFLPALRPLGGPARTRLLSALVPRFSTVAAAGVAVIIVTGLYQTIRLLDGWSALRDLTWGRALVVKLVLVAILLLIAAFNLLVVRPRLAEYARRMDRATRERAARLRLDFRRAVLAEIAVGAVILLVVGLLTGVAPAGGSIASVDGPFRPFVLQSTADGISGRLVLSPGRIGNNRFDLTLQSADGRPPDADASVVLRITTLDQETGTAEAPMQPLGAGRFTTTGAYLSTVGLWEVSAVLQRAGQDDVVLPFRLSLTEATGRPQVQENRPAAPLARGRELYQANCVQCHGVAGRGDGPLAAALRPPPLDLTVHVPLHSDTELTGWITNGIARTSMPAFGGQFSPEETQAIVNFLRELAKQSGQDR
jgi:copper transport protein